MRRFSEGALLVVGVLVVAAGVTLMFGYPMAELKFQHHLLDVFQKDYHWDHWRSIGEHYTGFAGLGAVIVGALMMALAAFLVPRQPSQTLIRCLPSSSRTRGCPGDSCCVRRDETADEDKFNGFI